MHGKQSVGSLLPPCPRTIRPSAVLFHVFRKSITTEIGVCRASYCQYRSVTCFANQFLYPPVQQLAHIEFIFRRTCNFVTPPKLLELFAAFSQHSTHPSVTT